MTRAASTPFIPRIALTPGEPAGIGPDLMAQLPGKIANAELVLFADGDLLIERARRLGRPLELKPWQPDALPSADAIRLFHVPLIAPVQPGYLNQDNAQYVLATLAAACDECLAQRCHAFVTGPVHKGIINQAGYAFSGHTEWLAERCGGDPVMMLAAPGLRVALATTHIPLAQVSHTLTASTLTRVARILYQSLQQQFNLTQPRILVCGLNPHAGENGYLGREEIEVIIPVLEQLRHAGLSFIGPLPADSLFTPTSLANADAVLAMYHDQGLPVLKHLGFGRAVNITLGLPIIRTSVDHGTALNLAGTDQIDSGSVYAALELAVRLSIAKHQHYTALHS